MSFLAIQGESQWVETLSPYNKIYEQLTNLTFVFEYILNLLKRKKYTVFVTCATDFRNQKIEV